MSKQLQLIRATVLLVSCYTTAMQPVPEIVEQLCTVVAPQSKKPSLFDEIKNKRALRKKKKENASKLRMLQQLEPIAKQKNSWWLECELLARKRMSDKLGSALATAAYHGDFKEAQRLVAQGAAMNIAAPLIQLMYHYKDHFKEKPHALQADGHEFVQWLIAKGADVNAVYNYEKEVTVLYLALKLCKEGCCIDPILQAGALVGPLELGAALASRNPVNVVKLLNQNEHITIADFKVPFYCLNHSAGPRWIQVPAFHAALEAGFDKDDLPGVLEMLYKRGARVDWWLVGELLHAGLSLEVRDAHGRTPLLCAIEYGDLSAVQELIRNGANPCVCNARGDSALKVAGQYSELEIDSYNASNIYACIQQNTSPSFLKEQMRIIFEKITAIYNRMKEIEELIEVSPLELPLAEQELLRLLAQKAPLSKEYDMYEQLLQWHAQAEQELQTPCKDKEECSN